MPIDRYLKSMLIGVILVVIALLLWFLIDKYYNPFSAILCVISIFMMWLDWGQLTIRKYKNEKKDFDFIV